MTTQLASTPGSAGMSSRPTTVAGSAGDTTTSLPAVAESAGVISAPPTAAGSAGNAATTLSAVAVTTGFPQATARPPTARSQKDGRAEGSARRDISRVRGISDNEPGPPASTNRRPDCGRRPFEAGKRDVDADSFFLRPSVKKLDNGSRRELLSFVTAITIDSVVLLF